MARHASSGKSPATRGAVAVLLVVAIMGTLWVPIYARSMPELGPFPFFYWYQLIWVPLTAVILWICYLLLRTKPTPGAGPGVSRGARK
jgi:Protein of unknown function (DUF3311)